MEKSIVFHVPDERFDRITPFQFSANTASDATFLPGFENLTIVNVVTTITEVDITPFGALSG